MFFTTSNVQSLLDKKMYKTLNQFGGLTRKTAQRSMRPRKAASPAGSPPSSHGNPLLRKLLFYAFDGKSSVVVGPVLLGKQPIGVPKTHEHGGRITRLQKGKAVTANYPARPYMKPAGTVNTTKLAQWYAQA
jgi:hypothetical protein